VDLIVTLAVFTALFSALYKFLPDVKLRWRDVVTGGFVTALLFSIGKKLIGLYLGQSSVASTYGAAGSIIILLLWVYYSSQIVLVGAEFTRVWTEREQGRRPPPEDHAQKEKDTSKKPGGVGAKAA
jgi:membrane protein